MTKTIPIVFSLGVGIALGLAVNGRLINRAAQAQTAALPTSFSAVPGAVGEEDISGP
jgi:hypothetical protein